MDATRRRLRFVLAIDALLVAACLFGLDGLNRKARLPVKEFRPTAVFGASRSPAPAGPVVRCAAESQQQDDRRDGVTRCTHDRLRVSGRDLN
jgi:hypothetical protein